MPRSKEIPEDLRKRVIEAHQSGKGYKLIASSLDLQISTIRAIVRKWKTFGTVMTRPRSGRPPKISPKERDNIIGEVRKNPCTTPKNLQATLASANIHVHDSTIRRILGKHLRPVLISYDGRTKIYKEEEHGTEASGELIQDVKVESMEEFSNIKTDHADAVASNVARNKQGDDGVDKPGDGNNGDDNSGNNTDDVGAVDQNNTDDSGNGDNCQ